MKIVLISALALLASGCSLFGPTKVDVSSKPVERLPLSITQPQPLSLTSPRWVVITPDNAESVWAKLRAEGNNVVLFAVTDKGYEQLAGDLAQIRTFIATQREIIKQYEIYYAPGQSKSTETDK